MSNDKLLRVLTLFDSSEEAEVLINVLRNAGHIVRDIRVEDDEDMESALEENPIDIILAKQTIPLITAKQAMEVLIKQGRDIPLIVITHPNKENTAMDALRIGARDAIASDQTERLKHAVNRELEGLISRRHLRRSEKMLRETEKRARDLIDSSRDAISYVHDGAHIYANQSYLKMFGYESLEDIEGMPILDMVSSEDHNKLKEFLRGYSKGQATEDTLQVNGQHTDGKIFNITMEFSSASMEGEACTQIIIRDQSGNNKELQQQLNVLSRQDLLTGLFNRTYFMEQADKLISRAIEGKTKGAMLYMVLDKYDDIKESIGISERDHFLADIAKLMKDKLDKLGTLARFEGPIFTLLINEVDQQKAEQLADKICHLVSEHIAEISGRSINTSLSIGLTTINETTSNLQDVMNRAEKGAEAAAKSGGNQYSIYSPAIEDLAEKEADAMWAQKIKLALKNNQFRLLYQPLVSLRGDPGAHYEVTVRLLDDDGKEVNAGTFMPVAERAQLTHFIDRWIIAHALMVLSERLKQGYETRFFIKLTAGTLNDKEFLPWIVDRIKTLRVKADNLVFMVNEAVALNYLKTAKAILDGLRTMNCRTGLENFGNEQNTFQSLKHMNINYVKIGHELAKGFKDNVENQDKIRDIADQATEKGIHTIAAFVEDANTMAMLWQTSVSLIQGNFLQQPGVEMNYDFEN